MEITAPQRTLLEAFIQRVEDSPHNLVSRRARGELRERHLPECEAFAHILPAGPATVLDVGSGGGFPGMIVAILRPDLEVTLLDGTGKKVEFLRSVAVDLEVPVAVVHGRAEEVQRTDLASRFDLVTARAVAPLNRLIGWTVPFLRPGGLLYAIKGERWAQELEEAAGALRTWGAETVATPEELGEDLQRVEPLVVIIRRAPQVGGPSKQGNR